MKYISTNYKTCIDYKCVTYKIFLVLDISYFSLFVRKSMFFSSNFQNSRLISDIYSVNMYQKFTPVQRQNSLLL